MGEAREEAETPQHRVMWTPPSSMLGLFLRLRLRSVVNRAVQAAREAPIRLATTVLLIGLVWIGLYGLFWLIFDALRRTPLEATVALPLVFNVFFAAILIMLTFSNAISAYASLFAKTESAYLLTSPAPVLDFVSLKYLESLMISSWSLVLLGLPLMWAMADQSGDPLFYALLLAFFVAFIPIPGGFGLLLAWAAARFFPRRAIRAATIVGALALAGTLVMGLRSMQISESATEQWLHTFLARMSFVESALLPNHWVASGIDYALQRRFAESFLYLGVIAANGMFISWLGVNVVTRYFGGAYDRASAGRTGGRRPAADSSGGLAGKVFFYLPLPLRLIAAKDLRTFFRDPLQGSQLLILFGLLALYLTNMPNLRLHFSGTGWFLIMPFLNLCAISLILATFTCRFVYPLPSLEGRQLWLLGLLPFQLRRVLFAKFAFALTITLVVAGGAMVLAISILDLDRTWSAIHLVVTLSVCIGLCGFAVGLGARFPMFHESNVARIASGVGGTANLLGSLALVAVVMSAVGLGTWRCRGLRLGEIPDFGSLTLCFLGAALSIFAGWLAMHVGAKHFQGLEA